MPTPALFRGTALACGALLCLAACTTLAPRPAPPGSDAATAPPAPPVLVPERWRSAAQPGEELDSLATWPTTDGGTWLIATAKATHTLVVFDAASGARLRTVGGQGDAPGRFLRPNGIAVYGDRAFVAERDNRRVQVLSLPGFTSLGSFGERELRSPYGLWLHETAPDAYEAYVTDSFMLGEGHDVVPPLEELDERVRRYRIAFDDDGRVRARDAGSFGDTSEAGALRIVESIAGDPAAQRLLIADESAPGHGGRRGSTLREYGFDGRPTGRELPPGSFAVQAEGVALWSCTPDSGYWIAVDQRHPRTHFLVFERGTLAPRGRFMGETTDHTDGIALHAAAMPGFPAGALFAVDDDQAVAAFDLGDVVRALALDPRCAE